MWVDHILELSPGKRLVAIKHVSLGDDHLDIHFGKEPERGLLALPLMPASLLIEGMAQSAGILVSDANDYKQKVILAKITACELSEDAINGDTLRYTADLERLDALGAATRGEVALRKAKGSEFRPIGRVDLMFSHLDNNLAGRRFPEHNFVLGDSFRNILRTSGFEVRF